MVLPSVYWVLNRSSGYHDPLPFAELFKRYLLSLGTAADPPIMGCVRSENDAIDGTVGARQMTGSRSDSVGVLLGTPAGWVQDNGALDFFGKTLSMNVRTATNRRVRMRRKLKPENELHHSYGGGGCSDQRSPPAGAGLAAVARRESRWQGQLLRQSRVSPSGHQHQPPTPCGGTDSARPGN